MIALTDIDIDIYIYEYQIPNQFDRNVFETRSFRLMPLKSCIPPMRAQASAPATRELQEWARLSRVCCDIPPKIS